LAIADSITGPYLKYESNPVLRGHGHFCWRYKHGMLMLPFGVETILWSENGIHFTPPLATGTEKLFEYVLLDVPYDPLCGKPVIDKPVTKYWGFDTVQETAPGATSTSVYIVRIDWEFGPSESEQSKRPALSTVPFSAVKVQDAFWSPRLETNNKVIVPHNFKEPEKLKSMAVFDIASGKLDEKYTAWGFWAHYRKKLLLISPGKSIMLTSRLR